ncbi:SET domain-containing protein 9 [Rhizoclosmatium sp. JEL0117]|nr:SET domain-containing protein 9 [Rhizoclosmatium sp. JEL0117]
MSFGSRFAMFQRISAAYRALAKESLPRVSFKGIDSDQIVAQITAICEANSDQTASTMKLPFRLYVKQSNIKNAGFGVFLGPSSGTLIVKQGTVVCLYPGVVYSTIDPIFFPSISNHFVLQRMDGSLIDGKHSGLSKYMFKSIRKRELAWNRVEYDNQWLDQRKEGESNNWNIGQLINNSFNNMDDANVVYNEFTLTQSFPMQWRRFIPNVPFAPEEENIYGIALVTTKDISFSSLDDRVELLASYQSLE